MSNIPEARRILEEALDGNLDPYKAIQEALFLMTRKSPQFVSKRKIRPLTEEQKETARRMRDKGTPMNDIARLLNTNLGRISEAING